MKKASSGSERAIKEQLNDNKLFRYRATVIKLTVKLDMDNKVFKKI